MTDKERISKLETKIQELEYRLQQIERKTMPMGPVKSPPWELPTDFYKIWMENQ